MAEADSAPATTPAGWLLLALAFLVALEFGSRVEDLVRFGTPLLSPYHDQGALFVRDAAGRHGRPGARFRKWQLNALGMRGPDAEPVAAPGTLRLLVLGASETFGLYESPGREYPRQLEDTLAAMRRDGRCRCRGASRIEVLNGGMLGMTLPTAEQDLRNRLRALAPDVVVLYPTPVAYLDDTVMVARPDSTPGAGRLEAWHWLYPRAVDRVRTHLKGILPAVVRDGMSRLSLLVAASRPANREARRFDTVPPDRLAQFESDLRRAAGSMRATGLSVLVAHANAFAPGRPRDPRLLRDWMRFYPRAAGDVLVDFDAAAAGVTARVATDSGAAFLDWHAESPHDPGTYADFSHFTDRGAAIFAHRLAMTIAAAVDRAP